MSQLIISIGREFGSGGHEIADMLSKHYNLPLYDHNLLREVAAQINVNHDDLKDFDETKKTKLFSRTVRGMSSCPAHNVAQLQFDFLKKKADDGESFVIVGRCSETVLKDCPALISVFVMVIHKFKSSVFILVVKSHNSLSLNISVTENKERNKCRAVL